MGYRPNVSSTVSNALPPAASMYAEDDATACIKGPSKPTAESNFGGKPTVVARGRVPQLL